MLHLFYAFVFGVLSGGFGGFSYGKKFQAKAAAALAKAAQKLQ